MRCVVVSRSEVERRPRNGVGRAVESRRSRTHLAAQPFPNFENRQRLLWIAVLAHAREGWRANLVAR
jgi:hypothetical protein